MALKAKTPQYLQEGDTVVIVSPAGFIEDERVGNARRVLSSWGLTVLESEYVLSRNGILAGTDEARFADVQWALNHPEAKAVIFSRGGYGSVRIISKLDFTKFALTPKWLAGFSDITVFHSYLAGQQLPDIVSIHSAMPQTYPSAGNLNDTALTSLHAALFGEGIDFKWQSTYHNKGCVTAPLVGGNLSVLYSLRGTPYDIDVAGKILLIEDLNEMDYHIDRMLQNFKQGGWFEQIAGLVAGQFTDIRSGSHSYPKSFEEIIKEYTEPYNIPVAINAPVGHIPHQQALYLNVDTTLTVTEHGMAAVSQLQNK
ncbi:MAG: LD-carboxypeptidase [Bacteroidales bacterium]|jgi:muramoyltetrapeptide carboxypeptidase|nr:LD-carboxypeptidase [Bacteroidales bacterium]